MLRAIKHFLRRSEPRAIVLMYHRICDLDTDPWQLAVNPVNFEDQIKTLTKHFDILPLTALIQQLANKKIKSNTVFITFDDAYADNFLYAKPILEKYACPATFFVPTYFIEKQQPFWWDELESIILHSKTLLQDLVLNTGSGIFKFNLQPEDLTEDIKQKQKLWKWSGQPPTNRCELYIKICNLFRPLPCIEILALMNQIKKWADFIPGERAENLTMTVRQLQDLSDNKLFTLGLHTETHPALASHPTDIQKDEIIRCKEYLEKKGLPFVSAIAYPYGSCNNDTLLVVAQNNIALGFTTDPKVITNNSLSYRLGRFQINDFSGTELRYKLKYWLNQHSKHRDKSA